MALDMRKPTVTTRTTGPLHAFDQCTMTIQVPWVTGGQQTYRVPGIIVQGGDPCFVEGYSWGRHCYYSDIDAVLNADGTPRRGGFTQQEYDTGTITIQPVRDITPAHVLHFLQDVLTTHKEDMSLVEQVGFIAGYFIACIETYYHLTCLECGNPYGLCSHPHPDPSTFSSTPEWFTATVKKHDRSGEEERLLLPGVLTRGADPAFAEFFSWGRESYANDVHTLLWLDGTEVLFLPPGALPQTQTVKDHDLTIADLVEEFRCALRDEAKGEVSRIENAGYFFGYLAACVEEFYSLACPECGGVPGLCDHV